MRAEELEQRLRSTETALKTELDEARREYKTLVELHQRLELESSHRNSEVNSFNARMDTLQVNRLTDFCWLAFELVGLATLITLPLIRFYFFFLAGGAS